MVVMVLLIGSYWWTVVMVLYVVVVLIGSYW